ncbi:tRNA (adenosine(37)-N6)-threonylcarbamoyltransferase complex ATPase subunit type 1 TsaE [Mesorhizobium sp. L-8-3]|uniref:tRNA (adenosine(37)-N6)-threonylcarbamoyltransferase complex ATPase subunit type 1 TsaE n=1 Tax=Mesorhizobium sp. L-8-3 TaxID=2744522 RepID=UPI0019293292|nr:tRNA (adenosine(37)-N6)-threonylcarbamoyltransferase complex ATPase subunit type 1 TsaE [Mesorhizobium sp. L-8-3]BCH21364.1 bifunctional tRNA (adenosine(37)-N6)-threonylcarbamoyltransferase complex ATPase subunit type 1 TsaE/phosphotransferase [Mesorhizobium sp. L-8-3]
MAVLERRLPDEQATTRLGGDIAAALRHGDAIALRGDLGAGKTTLARGLIRALAGDPDLEVPSPTFTLVQAYDTQIPVQHFDLYRLAAPDELDELGFDEALAAGVALVEWPEKAGDRLPADMVVVELADAGEGRVATIRGPDGAVDRIGRSLSIRDFLDRSGWHGASRSHLVGDASARSYETVSLPGRPDRVLMNSPGLVLGPPVRDDKPYAVIARSAQSVHAFVAVARLLRDAGVSVPEIYAGNLDQGFLLIENLGSGSFLDAQGAPIRERYEAAARLLAFMHERNWPDRAEAAPGVEHVIPPFDRDAMMIEAELLIDWYLPFVTGRPASEADVEGFRDAWSAAFDRLAGKETSLMMRDFHSPNIIWRAEREGHDRLGIIDFQDALIGPAAYDVASLALDARVTIPPDIEKATVDAYVTARLAASVTARLAASVAARDSASAAAPFDRAAFDEAYAIMGAQRNSKILGIFVRLDRRDGKPVYLRHLPRIRDYVRRTLGHPALAEVRDFYHRTGLVEEPKS